MMQSLISAAKAFAVARAEVAHLLDEQVSGRKEALGGAGSCESQGDVGGEDVAGVKVGAVSSSADEQVLRRSSCLLASTPPIQSRLGDPL